MYLYNLSTGKAATGRSLETAGQQYSRVSEMKVQWEPLYQKRIIIVTTTMIITII